MPWKVNIGKDCGLVQVVVSSKDTYLPNASTIGYDKRDARVGDWVVYQNNPDMSEESDHGRVLGQIIEHSNDQVDIKGYLVVLYVNDTLSHAHITYVNPKNVTRCTSVNTKFVEFLLGLHINEKTVQQLPRLSQEGWLCDRAYERAIEKLYVKCEEHGMFQADGKNITCPVCGGKATNG